MRRRSSIRYSISQPKENRKESSRKDNRTSLRATRERNIDIKITKIETEAERTNQIMMVKINTKKEEIMITKIMTISLEKLLRKPKNDLNNKLLYYF